MRRRQFLSFVLALLFAGTVSALDPSRPLHRYVHEHWETDEGLPQLSVRAIAQTRDGYLWLGTDDGLARFDGVRFTIFDAHTSKGLRANQILCLLEDHDANLWIGTHGGGLTRYRDGAFTAFTRDDALPSDFVYSLAEDRAGALWIGARRGAAKLTNGTITAMPDVIGGTVWSIEEDRAGTLWFGSDLNGLSRVTRGVATKDGAPHNAIPAIRELHDGRIVIGTNGAGLFEWVDGRAIPFRARGTLPGNAIFAIYEDKASNLWIGTNAGLARVTNGVITTDAPDELAHSEITAIAEDVEGSLWIGTNGAGLHRLRDGKAETMTADEGLPSRITQTVMHDRRGNLWIGTRGGALRLAPDGTKTTYTTKNGLPNDSVKSLFESSDGTIWLGTDLGGVVRITPSGLQTTILDPDVPDNTIRAFAETPDGSVWAGSNGGALTRFKNGAVAERIEHRQGMPRLFVRAMEATQDGSLWIATDGNGLVHLRDGQLVKVYTERDGLSRDSLRSLHIDADGTVWIGTDGAGLNRLRNGHFDKWTTHDGLADDLISSIVKQDGKLWMSSHRGIFTGSTLIDDHDGMLSRDCAGGSQPAGTTIGNGQLAFPTNDGVVIVDTRNLHRNRIPPPVHIERVVAETKSVQGRETFVLPRGTKRLEISYTALSFVVPERVRFKFKLEGYDDDWIDAGTRRTAYYTELRPGNYRFRVIAANDEGIWNERGATVAITLPPYFYQRRSFALLMILLAAGLVWAIVALRIRRIRREAARDAELERRLEVVQRLEALGQMASGIAHDFNNTLMSALPWAEMLRREYPVDGRIRHAADSIAIAVERAKNVTSQLLDFAQPKPPVVTNVDLVTLTTNAVSMARATMPPEIDIRLRVEPGDVIAIGDEAKLAQVLLNLVLNARDAMPGGGCVIVEVRNASDTEVLVSVSDTGMGIDPDVRERIFDPFFTTKGIGKGTGLGLSVVHRIVLDHNGSVSVESTPGQGSTFTVVLPKGKRVVPTKTQEEEPAAVPRGANVLLVDDEAVVVEVLRDTLSHAGMNVESVASGPEALRLLDEGYRPDVVILDLGLPEMTGEEVHAQIRARMRDLPILISSGYGDQERLEPLLRDPKTTYLQKPYRMDLLKRQIASMIG